MSTTLPHDELLHPISTVVERLTGRRPSPATVWRWLRKGVRGAKLNAVLCGGKWLCTEQDFRLFLQEQTDAALAASTTAARVPDVDEALKAQGLL